MAFEFRLPDIGEGIHEGEIVKWLVKPGDHVAEDQPLLEVMTDKVTAEIPSPVSGTITKLNGKEGEVVKVGSVIVEMEQGAAGGKPYTAGKSADAPPGALEVPKAATVDSIAKPAANGKSLVTAGVAAPQASIQVPAHVSTTSSSGGKVLAAPATRRLAREEGVELSSLVGSGPRGRVTQSDVRNAIGSVKGGQAVQAGAHLSQVPMTGLERRVPFSGIRRKIAEHLVHSKQTAPHFAYVEEVDMTEIVKMREQLMPVAEAQGIKLSFLPFMIKAVIAGLKAYPVLNSSLDEAKQEIIYKNYYNMGIAVATEQGLVVPVIKNAEHKNMLTLAREIKELSDKARTGKLTLDEMRGGTFTLTSIGSIGGLFGVPIINFPEVAILGINKINRRPVVRVIDGEEQIVIRDMMHLSISCDHRVVDGAEGALFVKRVIEYLESPGRLLLEG